MDLGDRKVVIHAEGPVDGGYRGYAVICWEEDGAVESRLDFHGIFISPIRAIERATAEFQRRAEAGEL